MSSIGANTSELFLRPLPFLDDKWLHADLLGGLRNVEDAAILWNNLIQDCELVSSPAPAILNAAGHLSYLGDDGKHYCGVQKLLCACCPHDYCGPLSACNCSACHVLDSDSAIKKMTSASVQQINGNHIPSDVIFESWLWGRSPDGSAKLNCQQALLRELHTIAMQAAGNCLSAQHLRQQLFVYERYFVALARSRQRCEGPPTGVLGNSGGVSMTASTIVPITTNANGGASVDKCKFNEEQQQRLLSQGVNNTSAGVGIGGSGRVMRERCYFATSKYRHQSTTLDVPSPIKENERATLGLARVGTRAALNFSFAFLRRAWRSGEDTEMCSELLCEALESLQDLPEASLFDSSQVSALWIEVLERSIKFLRQVALGDPMGGRCTAPREDRHTALCLLLELGAQKGTLAASLEAVVLLLMLWEKEKKETDDNRDVPQNTGAPLVPILRRYENICNYNQNGLTGSVGSTTLPADGAASATESFLRFLTIPELETANVDLKQAAVVIISHLDRLAKPHMPTEVAIANNSIYNTNNNYSTRHTTTVPGTTAAAVKPSLQAQASQESVGGISIASAAGTSTAGQPIQEQYQRIYMLGCSMQCSGIQYGFNVESSIGVTMPGSSGIGSGNALYTAPILNFNAIVKQVAVSEDCAIFLTQEGRLFMWNLVKPESEPVLMEEVSDVNFVAVASHCEGQHYLALDHLGHAYSWGIGDGGRLGHGGVSDREQPTKILYVQDMGLIKCADVVTIRTGVTYSAMITSTGHLYTWGRGNYGRLGHGTCDDKFYPTIVNALCDYKIVDVALGSGDSHTLCVTADGLLFAWGDGDYGKLGNGSCLGADIPQLIDTIPRVQRVFIGSQFSMALTHEGRLYSWGNGDGGRLGHGSLDKNGECLTRPQLIIELQTKVIVDVSVGVAHCLVLTNSGDVYGWGRNDYQQICPPSISKEPLLRQPILATHPSMHVKGIASGAGHSIIWSQTSIQGVPQKVPFVIDLSEHTFRLIDQLLSIVCGQDVGAVAGGGSRQTPNQEAECVAVACLNLLRLQLHSVIINGVAPKSVGLLEGSRLLVNIKMRILNLAGGSQVLKTMQDAAQWVLQIGWRILLPTASERAQTLTSLLPSEPGISSSGHRFMTDLLVGSLMTEGGLETALNQAIRLEGSECLDNGHNLPLLHLIKQLLRNNSALTQARLVQLLLNAGVMKLDGTGGGEDNFMVSATTAEYNSPSLDLLHRFQRLLFSHIHQSKDEDLSGSEALLTKYIQATVSLCIHSLQKAYEIALQGKDGVTDILKSDISDTLLFELIIGLILLKRDRVSLLINFEWAKVFVPLLHALDNLNRVICDSEVQDSDDLGWPGIICRCNQKGSSASVTSSGGGVGLPDDANVIRKHDLENHLLDGGKWIILKGFVCDVVDYQCENPCLNDFIAASIGKDLSAEMSMPMYRHCLEHILVNCRVGRFATSNMSEEKAHVHQSKVLTQFSSERALSYFLGLVSNLLQTGPALQPAETQCKHFQRSAILRGGLQVLQPNNPYDDEKGEARSHASTAGSSPTEPPASGGMSSHNQYVGIGGLLTGAGGGSGAGASVGMIGSAGNISNTFTGIGNRGTGSGGMGNSVSNTIQLRIESFISGLAEARLTEPLVVTWMTLSERFCKDNNLIWHQEFCADHPVQDLERLLTAVLIRHQSLGGLVLNVLERELSGVAAARLPKQISEIIRLIYQTKWSVVRTRQQLNRSYKEVCAPMLERLRFLLYEVRPAVSLEQEGLRKLAVLYRLPRFKNVVKKIIAEMRVAKKQLACGKPEDILNVTIQSQHVAAQKLHQSQESLLMVCPPTASVDYADTIENDTKTVETTTAQVMLVPILRTHASNENLLEAIENSNIINERKTSHDDIKFQGSDLADFEDKKPDPEPTLNNDMLRKLSEKWYFSGELNVPLMNEIVQFVMQEVCDVETVRRAMFCQVQRFQIRRQGLELFHSILQVHGLLDAVQYNMLSGYLGLHLKGAGSTSGGGSSGKSITSYILNDLNLITAFQKASLMLAQSRIFDWAVEELQRLVNQDQMQLKGKQSAAVITDKDNSNFGTYVFLKKLPRARFLLSIFGILAKEMGSNELSLIINSGAVGTILGLLSQTGGDIPAVKNTYELSLVYEDIILKQKSNKANLTGPELAKLMKIGTRIVRGADWKWGDQDGNPPGEGRIISEVGEDGWVRVEWYTGATNSYRMGKEGQYDLRLAESALNIVSPDTETEKEDTTCEVQLNGESHPTKLLRYACTKLLQIISIGIGLHSERMDKNAVRGISSMFRAILDPKSALANICGLDNWTTLGFLKAIAGDSQSLSKYLTTPIWLDFYVNLLEQATTREQDIFRKLHCLRLLQTVLVHWTDEDDIPRMSTLIRQLFTILGRIALYCPNDISLLITPKHSKPRVLLTASHSGTVSEEIITLLRTLHTLPYWNSAINAFLSQKLCVAAELFADEQQQNQNLHPNPNLNQSQQLQYRDDEHVTVMGMLCTIGGCDIRPRVGLQVLHEGAAATICGFTTKGKCLLSTDNQPLSTDFRKISLQAALDCADYSVFSLSRLPLNEMLLNSWSVLLYGPCERKESVPHNINVTLLRTQQIQLAVLNANCILYRHQGALRKILRQRSPSDCLAYSSDDDSQSDGNEDAPVVGTSEEGNGSTVPSRTPNREDSQPGSDSDANIAANDADHIDAESVRSARSNGETELLIQSILYRATQPSPVKAIYSYADLTKAALNCSQVLAAQLHTDMLESMSSSHTCRGGVPKSQLQPTMIHGVPVYNVAMSVAAKEGTTAATGTSQIPPPQPTTTTTATTTTTTTTTATTTTTTTTSMTTAMVTDSMLLSTPAPFSLIMQIMEMGFSKRSVESALKQLTIQPGVIPTPEQVVQWILEHPDVCANSNTLESSTDYQEAYQPPDSYIVNITSTSNVTTIPTGVGTVSGTTGTAGPVTLTSPLKIPTLHVHTHDPEADSDNDSLDTSSDTPMIYETRKGFETADQYAMYVRSLVCPGMFVRCCRDFEEIKLGDIGKVLRVDTEGLHDLNVQVDWRIHGNTYWVCFVHIELLDMPPPDHIYFDDSRCPALVIGAQVRLRATAVARHQKWGGGFMSRDNVGIVASINGREVVVDFPNQTGWKGLTSEISCIDPTLNDTSQISASGGPSTSITSASRSACNGGGVNLCPPIATPNDLIEDWSRCIRSLTVSSNETTARHLLDDSRNCWQSSSSKQGKHWIRLEMHKNVLVHSLAIVVSAADHSHMPSLIVTRVGENVCCLKEYSWMSVKNSDSTVTLMSNVRQYFPWVEIVIKQCRNNGIQCKVHELRIVGRRWQTDLDVILRNAMFLACDSLNGSEQSLNTIGSIGGPQHQQSSSQITTSTATASPIVMRGTGSTFGNPTKLMEVPDSPCTVMVWGLNDKEQLGGLKGSKVKVPTFSQTISRLRPIHIAGGSKSLFIVSQDGKVYACGEGTNGRLGLGTSVNVSLPRQIPVLHQYVVKKVAVHSGGKHALALTLDGKVFSWGEGEDGKLGHGNRLTLDKPKMIDTLRAKKIRDIACGSSHSAAITSSGELYTWGLGEYGRLGHGDNATQLRPKLVTALIGKRVVQVACGSRDAQTLALTENGSVYSWGDGDFGKLGRGGSEGSAVPHEIERLNGIGIIQIECGAQFSLALTANGEIWTWGKGDYYRLGHGCDQHIRKPQPIQGLRGYKVIHVSVGALHCLAVTDIGQVFAWGDNDHGQQGSGNTVVNKKPALVIGLDTVYVDRVACGSSHSIAWGLPHKTLDDEKRGPVPFGTTKDPLGGSSLGIYNTESIASSLVNGPTSSLAAAIACKVATGKASLCETLLSLETNGARQTALNHVINAISIMQARQLIVAALTSHSKVNWNDKMMSHAMEIEEHADVVATTGGYKETMTGIGTVGVTASVGGNVSITGNDVIVQGGGEAPADVMEAGMHEVTPETDIIPAPAGPLSAFHSLTGSVSLSASISSNAAYKHSKMSASAMSIMAATITNQDEIVEETHLSGLDDFTSLLGESEAKSLVELLKLSVAGRTGPLSTVQTIADTLIALGTNAPSTVGAMLLETCITELEDLCTSRCTLGRTPKPVMQESSHPYLDNLTLVGNVKIPGAEALRIEFDAHCSTEKRNDPLVIMDGSSRIVAMRSGRELVQWTSEIRIQGDEMRWKFTSDSTVNGWGWRFWVHAIMPANAMNERVSDRAVLSQPSMPMVMALLNDRLPANNRSVLLRLVAALAECANLTSLTTAQRIWSLKRLHALLLSKHAPRPLEPPMNCILMPLIPELMRQYEYEEPQVRGGVHLMHSDYFKTLAALACDMQLDTELSKIDLHKWAWFKRYCIAVRVAQALIKRTELPRSFCQEVNKKFLEMLPPSQQQVQSSMSAVPSMANSATSLSSLSCHSNSTPPPPPPMPHQIYATASASSMVNALGPSTSNLIQYIDSVLSMSIHESNNGSAHIPAAGHQYNPHTAGTYPYSLINDANGHYPHEDQTLFKAEHDNQLLQWLNRRPDDWALAWGGASTIYGWGHNHRGQLGGLEGSRIKTPTPCEALSLLRPVQLAGGEQTLFAVTPDGKLFATGYGSGGRLGVGGTDSWGIPTLVGSLQHVFIKKVAVNSGGKHCLALTTEGEVYSWGEGEDGKLGHGNRMSYDRPKLIEDLTGIGIVDIACGSAHSSAVTTSGHVLTWGKGRYGRLGHGDSEDQLRPKLVEALLGYRAVDIACGSGDAQTLCITDDDNVWSWGDGDYGKLGRGGSDGCKLPYKIESLSGLGVVKVECGSQFSVALTKSGAVYTWGKGDFHRLGHGTVDHVRRPKKVAALQGKKVVSIATGSLHCVACTDAGEVFTWGDNDEGQLGDGTVSAIPRPRLVMALQGKHIVKVTCGSAHTLALSTLQMTERMRPPPNPPLEYDLVRDLPPATLHARLILLHHFSELLCPCLAMLPISGDLSLGALKDVLVYTIKEAAFRKVIQTTMVRDKQHGPVIELNRIQVKRSRSKSGNGLAGIDGMKSVFGQMVQKLPLLTQEALSLPHRVWKVKFVGESVDDCGGGYSESIAEMCDELQNGSVPLLIPTPNGRGEAGANRDCFLLDPTLTSVLQMNMFRFLGVLMGIAVRTGSPLSLNLAEPVWRQLAGEQLRPTDLTEVDRDYVAGLLCIRNMDNDPKEFSTLELPFSTSSAKGHEVPLSTRYTRITLQNRHEYVRLALNFRLHEFDEQVKAVRDGMSKVIPVPLLSLFSASELQAMVCGSPDIPLGLLKSVATYKGFDPNGSLVTWFWEVMEGFTNQERSLFLRFVWGRTRLPRTIADFRGRDFVLQVLEKSPPDYFLPESYTCFFLLKMPRYSCKAVLLEKLKYAIHFCKSIDTDEYARVAMGEPTEATGSEDNSDLESVGSHDTV